MARVRHVIKLHGHEVSSAFYFYSLIQKKIIIITDSWKAFEVLSLYKIYDVIVLQLNLFFIIVLTLLATVVSLVTACLKKRILHVNVLAHYVTFVRGEPQFSLWLDLV